MPKQEEYFSPRVIAALDQAETSLADMDCQAVSMGGTPLYQMDPESMLVCAVTCMARAIDEQDFRLVSIGMLICMGVCSKLADKKSSTN